jgi:hypothetical protein
LRIRFVACFALVACGRVGFEPVVSGDGSLGDDAQPDAMPIRGADPPFDPPSVITELSSASFEDDPTISADQLEIVFSSSRPGSIGGTDLWASSRASTSDPWQTPRVLSEISTTNNESNAAMSPDGLTLAFSSGPTGNQDMYFTTRASRTAAWSTAVPLTALNSGNTDFAGSMTESLDALYFSSSRNASLDIYVARGSSGTWSSPTVVSELMTASIDSSAYIMFDETVLWFASDRPGTAGDQDIFVATRTSPSAPFDPPIRVVDLATAAEDSDPCLSPDGHVIYFSRVNASGTDLMMATR